MSEASELARLNVGKEKANVEIRKIAEDKGVPFMEFMTKVVQADLWSKLADAYNEETETKELLNQIKEL